MRKVFVSSMVFAISALLIDGSASAADRLDGQVLGAGVVGSTPNPIPTTAAEVPAPPPGTAMTKAYVQTVGRAAYVWGWTLVNFSNRYAGASKAPYPSMVVGGMPVGAGRLAMLTGYMSAQERVIAVPNQKIEKTKRDRQ